MRRLLATCVCVLAAILPAAAVAAGSGTLTRSAPRHAAANLLIDAQEWSLWPSRTSVPAGTVLVELWNRGQDMHDAWIRRVDSAGRMYGPVLGKVPVTLPGQLSHATWHLRAGRYELFCSMPGHMKLGMHARLLVTRG